MDDYEDIVDKAMFKLIMNVKINFITKSKIIFQCVGLNCCAFKIDDYSMEDFKCEEFL